MRIIKLLLLFIITGSAHAEVYKCQLPSKQIVYQPVPCSSGTINQGIIEIEKLNARQLEEAQNRLKATEAERQALDRAAQARREAEAAQWKAEAPQREAAAARREAEAARQRALTPSPYPMFIPYPGYGYNYNQRPAYHPNYRYNHDQRPAYNPGFSPNPSLNPGSSLHPSDYPLPYMPFSVFPPAR